MQRGLELLPPSHFCLAPPSTFQPSAVTSPGALRNCPQPSAPPPVTARTSYPGSSTTQKTGSKASSQCGVYSAASSAAGSRWGRPKENVAAWPPAQQLTRQLTGRVDRREGDLRRSSESRRLEERNDGQLHWSPANGNLSRSEAPPRDRHRDAAILVQQRTYNGTTGEVKANPQNSKPREREIASAERNEDHEFRDNTEEALARKLAMCQKIDKSLQFYADVRKKWSDGLSSSNPLQPPSTVAQNSSTHSTRNSTRSSGDPPRTNACAMSARNQAPPTQSAATLVVEKDRVRARENAPRSHRVQKELSKGTVHHSQRTFDTSGGRKSREDGRKPTQNQAKPSRPALNDLSSLPSSRTWTQTVTSTGKKHPTLTLTLVQPKQGCASRETQSENVIRVLDSDKAVEVTSGPKNKVQTPQKVVPVLESGPVGLESDNKDTLTKLSTLSSSVTFPASAVKETRRDEEKEEFNDFDCIQQDSDPESVEPLTGKFGEPILTGARPILSPPSPGRSTELAAALPKPTTSRQSSCESDGAVRQETVAVTRNDTVLARVLQAEEESRAGVSLTPNTSNDLAIARQIQEDLDQLSVNEDEESPPSGAIGAGPPTAAAAAMSKSNFESLRFLDDDPNYYGKGYDIGREYMVTEHNSISEEQKERNRNIPRKSVRKNNYSGRWSDEYRYRGFDERGHRNMSAEKFQPHERKTWAVGGTGIVTACVRDMRRSDALLEREEIDLAFEGRQELEEIESSIDSQLIERMSHQYEYKEKHRPKDPSVKPVTECAVCLDSFHVGDPLRLMPCSHTFHRFCVDKWLEENVNCPVCKADYHLLAGKLGLDVDLKKYRRRYW